MYERQKQAPIRYRAIVVKPDKPPHVFSSITKKTLCKIEVMIELVWFWDEFDPVERSTLAGQYRITVNDLRETEKALSELRREEKYWSYYRKARAMKAAVSPTANRV